MAYKKDIKEIEKGLQKIYRLLKKNLKYFVDGDTDVSIILASFIRTLCYESKNCHPLLFKVLDHHGINLICYGMDDIKNQALGEKATLSYNGTYLFSEPNYDINVLRIWNFKEWLSSNQLKYCEHYFTPLEMTKLLSEKEGGTHFDITYPEKLKILKNFITDDSKKVYNEMEKISIIISEYIINQLELNYFKKPRIVSLTVKDDFFLDNVLQSKNVELIKISLHSLLNIYPKSSKLLTLLATLYHLYLKDYDQAKYFYETSLKINPCQPEAHNDFGFLWDSVYNDFKRAFTHYRIAIQLKPDFTVAINNYRYLYERFEKTLSNNVN